MKMGMLQLRWRIMVGLIAAVAVGSVGLQNARGTAETAVFKRADIIHIDVMKRFGKLERSTVRFPHDVHTDILEKNNKDCSVCHLLENDKFSQKFKRLEDTDKQEVMEIYHNNCIGCHRENEVKAETPGPLECGECHSKRPRFASSRQPMGLNSSLHFRHSSALEKKCDLCHHEYDPKAKKLFYAIEKEGTCRYCHREAAEDNRISMQLASHASCLDCHRKRLVGKQDAGPIKCAGCHDQKAQKAIEKISPVPRMDRKQPDVIFVKKGTQDKKIDIRMNPVPFDHTAHETYNDSCRACHHASLTSCNSCHDVNESKEGKGIKLELAMHQSTSEQSCIGCHDIQKKDKNCAGCHAFIEKSSRTESANCALCHMKMPDDLQNPYQQPGAANKLLSARTTMTDTFQPSDIPDNVVIESLSKKKYEPVKLPHRKIVLALVKNIQGNKLASYFHREPGTVCQGCHHNSPAAAKPPSCKSCHGNAFDENHLFKPGLMAAYHRQCMECHEAMNITKPASTDCTACHIEKKEWLTKSG
ncbi:MAG: cytochrome C [Deltaproteobacteria bacterium]|nr:cytochrome C [Deltaproteobacteria bacterium]